MEMKKRYYFIEAFFITLLIFFGGLVLGVVIEKARVSFLMNSYSNVEISLNKLEDKLNISNLGRFSCSELISDNFAIGNEIYYQARIFQDYEESAVFTKNRLISEHKKFDKLRISFWNNSVNIKKKCGEDSFHTLVYLYDYSVEDRESIAQQESLSTLCFEIKRAKGNRVILIPIAKNLNISSLNTLFQFKDINESAFIVFDEYKVFFFKDSESARNYSSLLV